VRGSRDPSKLADWAKKAGANASGATFAEAARKGDLAVLAVKGGGAEEVVGLCGDGLSGKTVLPPRVAVFSPRDCDSAFSESRPPGSVPS
jgi:predicted dinucleotide-binding enzyme